MNQIDNINKELEPIRLKPKRNSTILIGLIVVDVLLMLSAIPTRLGTLGFIIPMFIVTFIAAIALRGPEKEYNTKAKYALSDYLFKPEFENYTFDPEGQFDSSLSRELSLHPLGDSFTSNDLITGTLYAINNRINNIHNLRLWCHALKNTAQVLCSSGLILNNQKFHKLSSF